MTRTEKKLVSLMKRILWVYVNHDEREDTLVKDATALIAKLEREDHKKGER